MLRMGDRLLPAPPRPGARIAALLRLALSVRRPVSPRRLRVVISFTALGVVMLVWLVYVGFLVDRAPLVNAVPDLEADQLWRKVRQPQDRRQQLRRLGDVTKQPHS